MTGTEKLQRFNRLRSLFTEAFHVAIRGKSAALRCRARSHFAALVPDLAEAIADVVGDGKVKVEAEEVPATATPLSDTSMAAFETEMKPVKTRKPYVRLDRGYHIPTYHGTGHERGSHVAEE